MIAINIRFPERDVDCIDEIVVVSQDGRTNRKYDNRSDFIRAATLEKITKEVQAIEKEMMEEKLESHLKANKEGTKI
jgi:Arc/MetJ-type ribon-helix-helix transcriptional regulator